MRLTRRGPRPSKSRNFSWLACFLATSLWMLAAAPSAYAEDARAQIELAADPAWAVIDPVHDGKTPTPAPDGVRYLLVMDQVSLGSPKPAWHRRLVYEVAQQRGLGSAGQFSIEFHPEYQRVRLHAIDVWRDGVREDRRAQARIEMLRRESELESGLLDGQNTLSVTIPDLRVGDRIDYRFSVVGANPVFGRDYYDVYSAAYSMPLAQRRVRFLYPDTQPLYWRITRDGYVVRQERAGAQRILDIAANGLRKVTEENGTPDNHDAFGKLWFSTAASWADIARWASPLYPARFADRGLAQSMVRKLSIDPADKPGSLLRAIAFAQGEIRYTGLDMGQNSHAPNPPELTVARRFGDCKDKSVLLVALLAEAGIRAEPVLVNTVRGASSVRELPSALAFDHVVVRAFLDGRELWIDPTRDRERGPLEDREPLPFGAGLPVHGVAGSMVTIPRAMPQRPLVDVDETIALVFAGDNVSAVFKVATAYAQSHAAGVRDNFESNGAEEVGKQYLRYMRDFYTGITSARPPEVVDSEDRDLVRTTEEYRLAWKKKKVDTFGIVLFQLSDWLPELDDEDRQAPLGLSGARTGRQTIRTSLKEGWSIAAESGKVSNRYFSFERTVRVEGKDLVVRGDWQRFAEEVPARDYALVRRDFAKARELLAFDVDLNSGLPNMTADFSAWRWPAMSVAMLIAALVAGWHLRSRNAFAGMLFHPGRTMAAIGTAMTWKVWTLIVLCGFVSVLFAQAAEYMHQREPEKLAAAVVGIAAFGVRMAISVVVLRWALRLLSVPAAFRNLFVAGVWSSAPPLLILMACALVAIGGRIEWLAVAHTATAPELPGLIVAWTLAVAACWWMLVSSVNGFSVAVGTSRRRVAAAMGLILVAVLALVLPFALFAFLK